MTKVLINGYLGRMGAFLIDLASERDDIEVVGGVDYKEPETSYPFATYTDYTAIAEKPDVIIDFSNPSALDNILAYALENNVPTILCTTGYSEEQLQKIEAASKKIAMFRSGNLSTGINLLIELAKKAASVLYPDFNIEVIEEHHNQKLDAPSGTALMIADEMSSVLDDDIDYEYDRQAKRGKRPVNEIGIHSIRGGTIVGEHEVIFAGPDEVIRISHSAASRKIFANGALNAAVFMNGKEPGMYSMKDVLAED